MNFLELYKNPHLIGAHRGASCLAPENTMDALQKSLGHCDFIEIDVQLTRDKEVVVFHDDTLLRTTDVAKHPEFHSRTPFKVSDFTLEELAALDYGSWFEPNPHTEPVLTLYATLNFIKKHHLYLNIEIKNMHGVFEDTQAVAKVLEMIEQTKTSHLILLSSFYHPYLKIAKKLAPHIPTAALTEDKHPCETMEELLEYLRDLEVCAYHIDLSLADRYTIKELKEAGFHVGVYTVNSPKKANELFFMGVDAIFSDDA